MTIGAISFQPYVYNVNAISPASMNRVSRISDNVLDKKTDYSDLTKAENENPLKQGETLDFRGMLEMQMQRGRSNAARMIKPAQNAQEETNAVEENGLAQNAAIKFGRENAADAVQPERETASENAQMNLQTAAFDGNGAESGIGNFRMQLAISAYEMFMTA